MILQIVFSFQKKNFSKRKSCRIEPHKPFQHSVNLRLFKKTPHKSIIINIHSQYVARSNHNTHLKNNLKQFLFGKYYIPSLLLYWSLRLKSQSQFPAEMIVISNKRDVILFLWQLIFSHYLLYAKYIPAKFSHDKGVDWKGSHVSFEEGDEQE